MNSYKHLLSFDLTAYGAALLLINQFVDDENIKVFEISPVGSAAQLILLSRDLISLQVIKAEATGLLKSQILDSQLVENIDPQLLPTYLSQNIAKVEDNIVVLEGASVSRSLLLAQKLLQEKTKLIDFRVIRTNPKNVLIVATASEVEKISNIDADGLKKTIITKVQKSLKAYFE